MEDTEHEEIKRTFTALQQQILETSLAREQEILANEKFRRELLEGDREVRDATNALCRSQMERSEERQIAQYKRVEDFLQRFEAMLTRLERQ